MAFFFRGLSLSEIGENQWAISDLEKALELGIPQELEVTAEVLLNRLKK